MAVDSQTIQARVASTLARMAASQATLNAYVTICDREARTQAAIVRADTPLAGMTFSAKDNIETAGIRTTYGSRTLADHVPTVDAIAIERLRAAGAVLVGKTTLPEFGSSILSYSPLSGTTKSPWSLDHTPGGSSSGAGASIAAGLETFALTTDAGASTRLPAGVCGVLGLKPTRGVIPYEQFPDGFGNFIHLCLMAREVRDMARALDAVSGEHQDDPATIGVAPTKAVAAIATSASIAGQQIHWRPLLGNAALDNQVRALCEATLATLKRHGATVLEINEPFENAGPTWRTLQFANFAGRFSMPDEATAKIMDPGFVAGAKAGLALSAKDLSAALYKRTAYFRIVQDWFTRCDWVATPVTTIAALPIATRGDTPLVINGQPAGEVRAAWGPYLNLFNLTGHPALALPAGFTRAGLPVGIQLVGRYHSDAALLALAQLIEVDRPWADRRPPHGFFVKDI